MSNAVAMPTTDGEAWRLYRCTNRLCPQVGAELRVEPERRGPFLAWPDLTCVCGAEPELVRWRTPHGGSVRLAGA